MRRILLTLILAFSIPQPTHAQTKAPQSPPYYTLPAAKLAKAKALSHDFTAIHFAFTGWNLAVLTLLLTTGTVARLRDRTQRITRNFRLQGVLLFTLLLLLRSALNLPITLYAHHLALFYGLSIQGWLSWSGDVLKSIAINAAVGSALVLLLFGFIRRSPQRWWLAFWTALIPIVFLGAFAEPLVIDPLFNHFTPLGQSAPQLTASLQQLTARAGVDIPANHMFLMRASDNTNLLNAYVSGLGASKRVVVWDTTLHTPLPILQMIFAHELGHYVLHHVIFGIALALPGLLIAFWLAHRILNATITRYGQRWRIASPQDWGSLGILLLLLSLGTALSEPIANAASRQIEHQADVYGQEAMHGLVPDPQATAVESFQILGEADLDDPDPSRFIEFWTYTHPSTTHRAEFAAHYNPWAQGQTPKYFPK